MQAFKNMSKKTRSNVITFGIVILAFGIMQGLSSAGAVSSSTQGLLVPITAYICLTISLNLVVGISGELSLSPLSTSSTPSTFSSVPNSEKAPRRWFVKQ